MNSRVDNAAKLRAQAWVTPDGATTAEFRNDGTLRSNAAYLNGTYEIREHARATIHVYSYEGHKAYRFSVHNGVLVLYDEDNTDEYIVFEGI
jgi:hypothetical protein